MESNRNIYVMDSCHLSDLLNKEKQKLVYVFDQLNDRYFFIELYEIIPDENQNKPQIVKFTGNPPNQMAQVKEVDLSDFFLSDFDEIDHFSYDTENLSEEDTFDY